MKNGCVKSTLTKGFRLTKSLQLLAAIQSECMKSYEHLEYQQEAVQKQYRQMLGGRLGKRQEQDGIILTRRNANCATRRPGALVLLATRILCLGNAANKRQIGRAEQHPNGSCCIRLPNGRRLSNTSMRETDTHASGAESGITDQTSYMPTISVHGQNTLNYETIRAT